MRTAIFIRSYRKDFHWLKLAIKSIDKYCTGFCETVIAVPTQEITEAKKICGEHRIVGVPDEPGKGYLDQQSTKMHGDLYTDADCILFTDSDTVFTVPTNPDSTRSEDGRILHLMTPWAMVGDAICWKDCIEKALGFVTPCEMMRRLPFVFPREVLAECRKHIEALHKTDTRSYILNSGRFSEFNVIGTFAIRKMPEKFDFRDTSVMSALPPVVSRQFWSWGGITPEVSKELKQYLP